MIRWPKRYSAVKSADYTTAPTPGSVRNQRTEPLAGTTVSCRRLSRSVLVGFSPSFIRGFGPPLTKTRHGGQTTLTITSQHAKQAAIQAVLIRMAAFLASLKSTAKQFTDAERLALILRRTFAKFLRGRLGPPALRVTGRLKT